MPKTKAPSRPNFFRRHIKLSSSLLIIFLLIAGVFIYERVALELNKRAFQQARSAIDTVYADIVRQVGPPDDSKIANNCSGVRTDFGEGDLYCSIDRSFIFGVNDKPRASQIQLKIKNIISSNASLFKTHYSQPNPTGAVTSVGNTNAPERDFYKIQGLECVVSYLFSPTSDTQLKLRGPGNDQIFYVDLNCTDHARADFFSS